MLRDYAVTPWLGLETGHNPAVWTPATIHENCTQLDASRYPLGLAEQLHRGIF
jgi:hypothetical protein